MGVGGHCHAPAALPPGKTWYLLCRRLGGPQGPVWMGAENIAVAGTRSPDRSAHSGSLYRLRHPDPHSYRYGNGNSGLFSVVATSNGHRYVLLKTKLAIFVHN
jgi:hypothetical protein